MISICIPYICIPHRFDLLPLYLFLYPLTPVMIWITVPPALHTQYFFRTDLLSSGAAFHAAQVQALGWVIPRFRLPIMLLRSAPLDPEPTFGIYMLCFGYSVYLPLFGYGGALSRHMFVCSYVCSVCRGL